MNRTWTLIVVFVIVPVSIALSTLIPDPWIACGAISITSLIGFYVVARYT